MKTLISSVLNKPATQEKVDTLDTYLEINRAIYLAERGIKIIETALVVDKVVPPSSHCVICFEDQPGDIGFACSSGHFMCYSCAARAISSTMPTQTNGYFARIKCMNGRDCFKQSAGETGYCQDGMLAILLKAPQNEMRDKTIDAFIRLQANAEASMVRVSVSRDFLKRKKESIEDLVRRQLYGLYCPSCDALFDHTTDACMHATCNFCSTHFCGFCFQTECDTATCDLNPSFTTDCLDKPEAVTVLKAFNIATILRDLQKEERVRILDRLSSEMEEYGLDVDHLGLARKIGSSKVQNILDMAYGGKDGDQKPPFDYKQLSIGDFCLIGKGAAGEDTLVQITGLNTAGNRPHHEDDDDDDDDDYMPDHFHFLVVGGVESEQTDISDIKQHITAEVFLKPVIKECTPGVPTIKNGDYVSFGKFISELKTACEEPVIVPEQKISRPPVGWQARGNRFVSSQKNLFFVVKEYQNGIFRAEGDSDSFALPITAVKVRGAYGPP